MADIVLATFNARYAHSAFGLRYLLANLGDLQPRTKLMEFCCQDATSAVLEQLLREEPRVVGFGVYIWNVDQTTQLVRALKRLRPEIRLILGGPEVSYETSDLPLVELADHVIAGEADLTLASLCHQLLSDRASQAATAPSKHIVAALPAFHQLVLPYELYTDEDLAQRTVYVEASRGCPYQCEFCLSSLDVPVREVDLDRFLAAMQGLIERGSRQFKFIDRTFNLKARVSQRILEFFHDRYVPGMFLHFEMVPDRLPDALREVIRRFPPGCLQFEVGIQTFDPAVAERISRRQDYVKVEENLRYLRRETGVHVHADLIVGLPGETLAGFARGFDRLVALEPQEIQVGLLKRLRGTPIVRHDAAWGMVYSPNAPYEVLETSVLDFATLQELKRFSRYWDLVANSGNFVQSTPLLWGSDSPFSGFWAFCRWLHQREGRAHAIALNRLTQRMFEYLTVERGLPPAAVAPILDRDYARGGRVDRPACLKPWVRDLASKRRERPTVPPRQARRL